MTATRSGAEQLLDVPAAISVIAPESLAVQGVNSLADYVRNIPSTNLVEYSQGLARIDMRGLVATRPDFTLVQERSLVAVYLDDTPITLNVGNPELKAVDLERIEVLRGPQGTLYGAGSMAGTIRYVSRKPDSTQISGSAEAQVFDTEGVTSGWDAGYSIRGLLNLPLSQNKAALLVSVYNDKQGGYVDDVVQGNDVNKSHSTQARVALRLTPIEGLTLDASMMYLNFNVDGFNALYRSLGNKMSSLTPQGVDDDMLISNLTATYDTGSVTLVSSTSYVHRNLDFHYNLQSLFAAFLPGGVRPSDSPVENEIRNFTQEVRLLSDRGPFKWQAGAFYGHDSRTYIQNAFYEGLDALIGVPSSVFFAPYPDDGYYANIQTLDKQFALFAEGTVPFGQRFEGTVGLRYFNYDGPATYTQGGLFGVDLDGSPLNTSVTERSSGVNPRAALRYKPNDTTMIYAEAARGFRYGGVNYPVPLSFCGPELAAQGYTNAPATFGPDHVWTYTLGEKSEVADRRLALNSDVFYIKWTDAQTVHPLQCGFPFNENSGPITSKGVELELQFRATDRLLVAGSASYTDATSDKSHPNNDIQEGDRVPFFPIWAATVSGDYRVPLPGGSISFNANYSYQGSQNTYFDVSAPNNRLIPAYHALGASITYQHNNWEAGLYGKNLTNAEQISNIRPDYAGPGSYGDRITIGRPLTVGARFEVRF